MDYTVDFNIPRLGINVDITPTRVLSGSTAASLLSLIGITLFKKFGPKTKSDTLLIDHEPIRVYSAEPGPNRLWPVCVAENMSSLTIISDLFIIFERKETQTAEPIFKTWPTEVAPDMSPMPTFGEIYLKFEREQVRAAPKPVFNTWPLEGSLDMCTVPTFGDVVIDHEKAVIIQQYANDLAAVQQYNNDFLPRRSSIFSWEAFFNFQDATILVLFAFGLYKLCCGCLRFLRWIEDKAYMPIILLPGTLFLLQRVLEGNTELKSTQNSIIYKIQGITSRLEGAQSWVTKNLEANGSRIATLFRKIKSLYKKLTEKLSHLTLRVDKQAQDIKSLDFSVTNLKTKYDQILILGQKLVTNLKADIASLGNNLKILEGRVFSNRAYWIGEFSEFHPYFPQIRHKFLDAIAKFRGTELLEPFIRAQLDSMIDLFIEQEGLMTQLYQMLDDKEKTISTLSHEVHEAHDLIGDLKFRVEALERNQQASFRLPSMSAPIPTASGKYPRSFLHTSR